MMVLSGATGREIWRVKVTQERKDQEKNHFTSYTNTNTN